MLDLGVEPGPLPKHLDAMEWIPRKAPGTHGVAMVDRNQGIGGRPCIDRAGTSLCSKEVWQLYGGLSGPSHPKVEKLITYCTVPLTVLLV